MMGTRPDEIGPNGPFWLFDSPSQPGEFASLQLKKSLTLVQNQLLARLTKRSNLEGWWEGGVVLGSQGNSRWNLW